MVSVGAGVIPLVVGGGGGGDLDRDDSRVAKSKTREYGTWGRCQAASSGTQENVPSHPSTPTLEWV